VKINLYSVLFLLLAFSKLGDVYGASNIYFFYGRGCPHCVQVENFFEDNNLFTKYPIEKKEVYSDRDNAVLYTNVMEALNVPDSQRGVPTVVIGTTVLIGDTQIISNFMNEANKLLGSPSEGKVTRVEKEDKFMDLTFPVVIAASLVDAINPCAFAVLIVLMTTILVGGDSKKALKSGAAFASSIFISYLLMGLGLYKALEVGGLSGVFYKTIGWLAIFLGLFNLKDWLWYGKGFLMEVPVSWRPKLKSLINSVTTPYGAFGIGFLVSLFLLPCTSGPYIVILGMLAKKALQIRAIFYLVLYNLIFVSPMVLISWAVYKGFDPAKAEDIRKKHLKTLHLVAGLVMLGMGFVVLTGLI